MFIFLGFLLTTLFGLFVSFALVLKVGFLERLGISYVLGLGLQTLFMFVLNLFHIKFTLINSVLTTLIVALPFVIFYWERASNFLGDFKDNVRMRSFSKVEKVIVLVIMCLIAYNLISTLYWPVSAWDSLVLYDWRARLFYETGFMAEGIERGYFFGVPLLTSLAHTWVYLLGGKYPEFIYPLYLFAFAAMFYGSLKMFTSRIVGLFATLILVTLPNIYTHSAFSYTNFPYTVYFVMSTIYLYLAIVKNEKGYLPVSAVLLGLSTWTRSAEPFWMINLVVLTIYFFIKKNLLRPIVYSILFFLIRQPWVIFENRNLSYDTSVSGKISQGISVLIGKVDWTQVYIVLMFLGNNFLRPLSMFLFIFGAVFLLSLLSGVKKRSFVFEILIFGYVTLTVVGTYVFSLTFRDWQIGGSLERMVMFLPPLIIYYIASSKIIGEVFRK